VELHHPKTAREAMEIAGLDYTVTRMPLELKTDLRHDAYASVRADSGEVLAVVGGDFKPTQNRDAFSFLDALVATHKAEYETAGVLGAGERVWLLAKLPGYIMVHGNDIVNKYLLLTNSHTDGGCVRAKLTPIRAICNNSLTSDLQFPEDTRVPPVQNAAGRYEQAARLLASTSSSYGRLDTIFNAMAAKAITALQLREYVEALVPDDTTEGDDAGRDRTRNDVLQLHESGRGAHLAQGTLWGAFNSISEYTDYKMLEDNVTGRLNSIWFGRGEQIKRKAFHLAEQML
jgi:phage/plasmid-like protein (TIGR03299 family)